MKVCGDNRGFFPVSGMASADSSGRMTTQPKLESYMTTFLTNAARYFYFLGPVSDTQAYCAKEMVRENSKAQHQLRSEYADLFEADLRRSPSALNTRRVHSSDGVANSSPSRS